LDDQGISQRKFGFMVGMDASSINKIVGGQNVTWKTIIKFAEALQISPGQFFADDSEMIGLMLQELPPDLIEWLRNRKNHQYLYLLKDAHSEGITVEKLTKLIELYREIDKNV
jgi:transcriptional regulator with XRE-family HTH domain